MRFCPWVLGVLLWLAAGAQAAPPQAALTHGINITAWFRFPASRDPAKLGTYLTDQALADLQRAGFDFIRLAIDPEVAEVQLPVLIKAIRRIQDHGLAVVVSPHPHDWHLETSAADRTRLLVFWHRLALALQPLNPVLTVPEILNEPVFPHDPAAWASLQHRVLADIRALLPSTIIVLTGQDWGSIGGLLALPPEEDPNVIYSFHFYDPAELTSLAAYRPGLDRAALTHLPFPADDKPGCDATADASTDPATADLMHYYCRLGWNAAAVAEPIDRAAAWAGQHHARLLAGEFGASSALPPTTRLAWLRTVREACDSRGIAWALWGYDDVMGLGITRPPAPRPALDRAVLTALGLSTRM